MEVVCFCDPLWREAVEKNKCGESEHMMETPGQAEQLGGLGPITSKIPLQAKEREVPDVRDDPVPCRVRAAAEESMVPPLTVHKSSQMLKFFGGTT